MGQAFAARTYAELAMVTADIPTRPARARPAARPARRPIRKNTVEWGLLATGAMVPPAMIARGLRRVEARSPGDPAAVHRS